MEFYFGCQGVPGTSEGVTKRFRDVQEHSGRFRDFWRSLKIFLGEFQGLSGRFRDF